MAGAFSDCRKTYITKRVVRPTPINPQKPRPVRGFLHFLRAGRPAGPAAGRPYFLCFSAYNQPGAGAQYGSGGTPPAPCKNSKKWPKPLFRHAQGSLRGAFSALGGVPSLLYCAPALGRSDAERQRKYGRPATGPAGRPALEKCKKPRTGRGFLRIYRGRADDSFRYIGFSTV